MQLIKESDISKFVDSRRKSLIKMIGEDTLTKEMSFAIQAVNANSYLAKATHESVAKCIWNIAITGLTLNPVHQFAYITPRSKNGVIEAVLTPSYKGLVKLITDTGSVKNIYAYPVYEGDEFNVSLGTEQNITHNPSFKSKKLTHVYAVARLKDGSKQIEVMSEEEINEIRACSDSYKAYENGRAKSSIWVDYYGEMARKTVVKRITKYLPKTDQWDNVQEAISIDNEDFEATDNQLDYIEILMDTSIYDETQKEHLKKRLAFGINNAEAQKIIEDLKLNQREPIASGDNYSQNQISDKIRNEI